MEKPNRPLVPVSPTAIPLASAAIADGFIQSRIFTIRGVQVMLSPDLADLYQVETRSFNQAVKRNAERFPPGFRFQLTGDELREVITNCDNPDRLRFSPQMPYAFTEQGVAMLSGVLKSEVAVRVSIRIMETFVAMRRAIASIAPLLARIEATDRRQISDQARNDENQNRNEERFKLILDAMRDRTFPPQKVFFDGQVYDAFEQMKRFVRMAKAELIVIDPYFADSVLPLVAQKRSGVAAVANVAQVYTNYEIGRQIVEEEQGGKRRADYGKRIIKDLSSKLTARFGRGWSFRTLETMRKFYILYAPIPQKAFAESGNGDDFPDMGKGIPQTPFAEFGDVGSANGVWQADGTKTANTVCQVPKFSLSWSHYLLLMRIADPVERAFYEREAADRHWSFRRLERMYRTSTFERRPQAHRRRGKAQVRNGEAARPRREIRKSPRVGAARGANVVRAVCACRDAGESPRMSASRLADPPTWPDRQVGRSLSRHRPRRFRAAAFPIRPAPAENRARICCTFVAFARPRFVVVSPLVRAHPRETPSAPRHQPPTPSWFPSLAPRPPHASYRTNSSSPKSRRSGGNDLPFEQHTTTLLRIRSMKKLRAKKLNFFPPRNVLSLTAHGAREFFLKAENYFKGDVPSYFDFGSLLHALDNAFTTGKPDVKTLIKRAAGASTVNYVLHMNKDGRYASRPVQFIHPVLYIALVDEMTKSGNWKTICDLLRSREDKDGIKCTSVSVAETRWDSYQAEQILVWWSDFEQESIALALEYPHVFITDLSDCYGSIRSNDIPRVLHGRGPVKAPSYSSGEFGDRIDLILRAMHHGQVGRLPQGSTLMDVLAELVLSELDEEVRKRIKEKQISGFRILRYRDDYRIFVKNASDGKTILTLLAEAARGFGLKLNSAKTLESGDVISSSIKADKLEWMPHSALFKKDRPSKILSVEKQLLLIYRHGLLHPNAGSLLLPLSIVHKQLVAGKAAPFKPEALIAIVAEIAVRNPRTCKPCIAIIAKLLQKIYGNDREAVCDGLLKKFRDIPHGGHFEIWLQRIFTPLGFACEFGEPLCKLVNGTMQHLPWPTGFLSTEPKLKAIMDSTSIVDRKDLSSMKAEFTQEEIDLFVLSAKDYA